MRVLVTGVTGFAGGHLAESLAAGHGFELCGLSRRGRWPAHWQHLASQVALHACDLSDTARVEKCLRQFQPQRIFHLAGYAQVGPSFHDADAAWSGNLTATRCLYEAVGRWGGRPRIVAVSSGMVYGDPFSAGATFVEDCPLRPASPYAASKAAADLVSYQVTRFPGLEVVRARPFNHIGPRQAADFAVAHFAQQIAAIERGRQPAILSTGNLAPVRDFTDVRDTVSAYALLMEAGVSGEAYNIASGHTFSIREVLNRLLALARRPIQIREQPQLLRAVDQPAICGDSGKIRRLTRWEPRFSLDQTLADTLAYWRQEA
jgi:GDP-4-dehydro-6-deoxy-D-mannose reductase